MADLHSNVSISGADGDDARVEAVGDDRPDAGREGRQVEEPRFAVEVERANEPVLRNEQLKDQPFANEKNRPTREQNTWQSSTTIPNYPK